MKSKTDNFSNLTKTDQLALIAKLKQRKKAVETNNSYKGPSKLAIGDVIGRPVQLTPAQTRMLFLCDMANGVDAGYIICGLLYIDKIDDHDCIRASLEHLLVRHPALRIRFERHADSTRQIISEFSQSSINEHFHVRQCQPDDIEVLAKSIVSDAMDVYADPLAQFFLFDTGSNNCAVLFKLHHLITDGWSLDILFRDFKQHYQYLTNKGSKSSITITVGQADKPIVSFLEYAIWLNGQHADRHKEGLDFWQENLTGAPELLNLPTDFQRPAIRTGNGGLVSHVFTEASLRIFSTFAKSRGRTEFSVLLSVLNLLLYRLSGTNDICVGTAVANRDYKQVEQCVGLFVNTIVLRNQVTAGEPFTELLERVQANLQQAFRYRDTPFEQVVEQLNPNRSLAHTPLYQVMFVYQDFPVVDQTECYTNIHEQVLHNNRSRCDLTFILRRCGPDGMELLVEYNTDLFEPETVQKMAMRFDHLVQQCIAQADLTNDHFALALPEESALCNGPWNGHRRDWGSDRCIHELFFQSVCDHSGRVAIYDGDVAITYQELFLRSCCLAEQLQFCGVAPDELVGVMYERGWKQVVAVLAVIISGAAYLPVNSSLPLERRKQLLQAGRSRVMVSDERLGGLDVAVLAVPDDLPANSHHIDPKSVIIRQNPDNLAYVIFTSGSTGKPKGVAIEHASVVNTLRDLNERFSVNANDKVFAISELNFDLSVYDIFGALIAGAAIVYPDRHYAKDPAHWVERIKKYRVTIWNSVPALVQMLTDYCSRESENSISDIASIRTIWMSGDWIPVTLPDQIMAMLPGASVISMGGATEASIWSIIYPISSSMAARRSVPYGNALTNQRFYVLNAGLQICPPLIEGDLYIGGVGLAREYWSDTELTSRSFITHPETGERLYRTGDRGRWLNEGVIEFLGRLDFQVKIDGFRIEIGEIELALSNLSMIRKCLVTVKSNKSTNPTAGKILVAYVALSGDYSTALVESTLDDRSELAQQLTSALGDHLPHYMIPRKFVVVDTFPLTANGKVDVNALPLPDFDGLTTTFAPPKTPAEVKIANIWANLLAIDVSKISRNASFFSLGGNSLKMVHVATEIRKIFSVRVPISELFRLERLEDVAACVMRFVADGREDAGIYAVSNYINTEESWRKREKAISENRFPATIAQQSMWQLHQYTSNPIHYNLPIVIRLRGAIDYQALKHSFYEIVRNNDALRMTFRSGSDADGVWAALKNSDEFTLECLDLSTRSPDEMEAVLADHITENVNSSFNLSQDYPIVTKILKFSEQEAVLLINMHHIAVDGVSMELILRQFEQYYTSCLGRPTKCDNVKSADLIDYMLWFDAYRKTSTFKNQVDQAVAELTGLPALHTMPFRSPRPAVQSFKGGKKSVSLGNEYADKIRHYTKTHYVTPFTLFNAIYALTLSRYSRSKNIVIGAPFANRTYSEFEKIIGLFTNAVVIRFDVNEQKTFLQLLKESHAAIADAFRYQSIPFEMLVDQSGHSGKGAYNPLFQLAISFNTHNPESITLPGLNISVVTRNTQSCKFDLHLNINESPKDGYELNLEYNADIVAPWLADEILQYYRGLLEQALLTPDKVCLALASKNIADAALSLSVGATKEVQPGADIGAKMSQVVERYSQKAAIKFNTRVLTYGELAEHSDSMARFLEEHGVLAGSLVAISVHRSEMLVPMILAVLNLGAAYLPLDPSQPDERKRRTIADSAASHLITDVKTPLSLDGVSSIYTHHLENDVEQKGRLSVLVSVAPDERKGTVFKPIDKVAYVIYTSGSTGKPKGVVVTHQNVMRLFAATDQQFGFSSSDIWTFFHSHAFDFSVWEIWGALFHGGLLVVVPDEVARSTIDFYRLVDQEHVTILNQTPSAFTHFVEQDLALKRKLCLRKIIFGGEKLELPKLVNWTNNHSLDDVELINMYGITETTVHVTYRKLVSEDFRTTFGGSPIGWPIADLVCIVVDESLSEVPVGAVGELYVGGDGVAVGYLHEKELTAERFIELAPENSRRLYKSGDLVRRLPAGELEYIGRIDAQVKIRGYRIELGEIAHALLSLNAITNAVCKVVDEKIVAYLQSPDLGDRLSLEQKYMFKTELAKQLPPYMIPAAFIAMLDIPLTVNGKVDYKALPDPSDNDYIREAFGAPESETEVLVASIWSKVLQMDVVSKTDNFFLLGGHSLSANRVIARISEVLHCELPTGALYRNPQLNEFASFVETHLENHTSLIGRRPALTVIGSDSGPLTFSQLDLWYLYKMDPQDSSYNISTAFRLDGPVDIAKMKAATDYLQQRHSLLRARFIDDDDSPKIRLEQKSTEIFSVQDATKEIGHLGESQWEDNRAVKDLIAGFTQAPFDLVDEPLVRVRYVELGKDCGLFLVNIHHIIADLWSLELLLADFCQYYNGTIQGVSQTTLTYLDYAYWQRSDVTRQYFEHQASYWKGQLDNLPLESNLPFDYEYSRSQGNSGRVKPFWIARQYLTGMEDLLLEKDCSLFMFLVAAYGAALGYLSGGNDIAIGTDHANRGSQETDAIVGFFINQLVIRARIQNDSSVAEYLEDIKQTTLGGIDHRDLPFSQLVRALPVSRVEGVTPLFQAKFVLYNTLETTFSLKGVKASRLNSEVSTAKFDLLFSARQKSDGLLIDVQYRDTRFTETTVNEIFECFREVLIFFIQSPDSTMQQLHNVLSGKFKTRTEKQLKSANSNSKRLFAKLAKQPS